MNNIRQFREKKGFSQIYLASELNVSQQAVAKWESDEMMPRADKLAPLAKLLECTVDELLHDDQTA